jgi:hypothetical protein
MKKSKKAKREAKPMLNKMESLLLFAMKSYPATTLGEDMWASLIGEEPHADAYKSARDGLVSKGYVHETANSAKSQNGQAAVYRITNGGDIPNFFVAKIPKTLGPDTEKFIQLQPVGGVENIDISFVIRTKDYHKFSFLPDQKGVFTFQSLRLSQEEVNAANYDGKATVCVEPQFAFTKKRDAVHIIGHAIRGDRKTLKFVASPMRGLAIVESHKAPLKSDCFYRFKISEDFSPLTPRVTLSKNTEIYNPYKQDHDFAHIMKHFNLLRKHSKETIEEARNVQQNAGPYIASVANDNKFIISIDDPGTKCIDDAFTLQKHSDGYSQETYVIAVPMMFGLDSPLYEAALKAGPTLYAGSRTVCPSIPEVLSHGKSSLHEGQHCPVLVIRSEYDRDGRLLELDFEQSFRQDVISVSKNITPREFKAGVASGDPHYTVYKELMAKRRHLAQRATRQPLQGIFNACADTGIIDNNIVADRMLNANALAGYWLDKKGLAAGYRNYALGTSPSYYDHARHKVGQISQDLANILPRDAGDYKASHIIQLLDAAKKVGHLDEVTRIIKEGTLDRSLYASVNRGHQEIGAAAYATISSAARRPIDYINQSLILSELGCKISGVEQLYDASKVQQICEQLNDVQIRQAALFQASKQRSDRAVMNELSHSVEPATILDITAHSMLVKYDNYNVTDYFNTQAMAESGFIADAQRQEIVLPSYYSGLPEERFAVGNTVNIRLFKDDSQTKPIQLFNTVILPKYSL